MRCALSPASAPGERPPAQTTPAPPSLPPPPPASPTRRRLQPPPLPLWQRPLAQRRSAVCAPRPAVDGTQLADLPVDGVGQLLPVNGGVAQCHLELGPVKGVPPSGVMDRTVAYHVARACLYDGARFHGSVVTVRPRKVKAGRGGHTSWQWDAGVPLLVRCPLELLQRGIGLYLELNVAHQLLPEEVERLPPKRAAQQVTEVCVAYALLDLSTLPTLHAARSLSMPLRGGPLALRLTLQQCAAMAAARDASAHGGKAAPPKPSAKTSLPLTIKPVPPQDTAAALLPRLALASAPVARVISEYRQLLAEALGAGAACLAPVADPVLAAFPAVLDDEDLSAAFMQLWRQELKHSSATGAPPATAAELRAAFRRCATTMWAARGAQAVPPPTCASHVAQHEQRRSLLQQFAADPAASLGSSAHAWLHRPFDCRELRTGQMEQLGATV